MKILNVLKFILIFLLDLIRNNFGKTSLIAIIIASSIFMGTFSPNREEYRIIKEVKVDDVIISIYPYTSDNIYHIQRADLMYFSM